MFNNSTFSLSATLLRPLLALLLLFSSLSAAAQTPAWQSAQAIAVATAAASNNYSVVTATAVDAVGNVYLTGTFSNTVVLGGITLTSSSGSLDVFVAKFNAVSNQFVWAQQAGGSGYDQATALALSGTSVYVAGHFDSSTASFGPAALTNASIAGGFDVFVAKLTDAGSTANFVWAQRAGGLGLDYAHALAVSGTSVYVTGHFSSSTASFGATTLTNASNAGGFDVFVAKLTDAGSTANFVWAQRAGGSGYDYTWALAVSGTNVYMAGSFSGSTASFGATTLTNASTVARADIFVTKLTDAGSTANFVWAQRAGGSGQDEATALALSGTSVYVAGHFDSSTAGFGAITLFNSGPNSNLGFLAALTDPTVTATAANRALVPAQLFPNPARHTATLRLPTGAASVPLTLTDAQGRVVRHYPAPAGVEATLNLRGLPAGLYLLHGAGLAQRLIVE